MLYCYGNGRQEHNCTEIVKWFLIGQLMEILSMSMRRPKLCLIKEFTSASLSLGAERFPVDVEHSLIKNDALKVFVKIPHY